MITLIHTGMQVPSKRVRVTSLKQVETACGIAWSAVLRFGKTRLGILGNDGQGSDTQFLADSDKAAAAVAYFVSRCRDHNGEPMDEIDVMDALADEYEIAREVKRLERRGAYYVRYFDRLDIPGRKVFKLEHSAPPDYEPGLKAAAHLDMPEVAVRAELWTGEDRGWVEFYRTDRAPE